jgi:ABC-type Fe3+/spermidine/putrescine transport system ATPase subunit
MGNVNLLPGEVGAVADGRAEIVIAGLLRIRAALPDGLGSGAKIDVAVRPESLVLTQAVDGAAPAEVTELTFLGNINEYLVRLGGQSVRVQTQPKERFAVGDSVGLTVDAEAISIFART